MPSIVDCPSCNRKLRIPDDLVAEKVQCPTCGSTFAARNGAEPASSTPAWEQTSPSQPSSYWAAPAAADPADIPLSRARPNRRYLQAHRGPLILVLGILSVVPHGLHLILGPIAWVLGNNDLAEMRAGRMDPEGEGMTNAGRICGIIGTIMGLLALLLVALMICIWLGFAAMIFGAAASQKPVRPASPPPPQRKFEAPLPPGLWLQPAPYHPRCQL